MKRHVIKRTTKAFFAIFFPWIAFLIEDNPGAALVAIILQATLIGWIPASIWAWNTIHNPEKS